MQFDHFIYFFSLQHFISIFRVYIFKKYNTKDLFATKMIRNILSQRHLNIYIQTGKSYGNHQTCFASYRKQTATF